MIRARLTALAVAGAAVLGTVVQLPASAAPSQPGDRIEVFGHRGASGYRPEHTLASYELAARMGADYIEPDLVPTKDGVLVSRHENEISGTTDVARRPEFADRRTTKVIDGQELTGWFTEDFTLAELKTLRAVERIPDIRPNNTVYDGRWQVPTFQEVLDLRARLSKELGREIGVAPETKHPSYFARIGLPLEPGVVQTLDRNGLNKRQAKVVVQSFEVGNLKRLDESLEVGLVQLISNSGAPQDFVEAGDPRTYADLVKPEGLREIAGYADVIGPDTKVVLPVDDQGRLTEPTTVVADAHAAGLQVVPYTVRAENHFLPADFRSSDVPSAYGDVFGFYAALFAQDIDGIFADHPDTAVIARDEHAGR
ncbi:glycerophosphoryl diester phosphodiesterase [Saccharopolyspora erythraea NRRL 2338]|uniref:glycerophosphodiester phosphodiesterase n=2 Tax=Saccharopolyspora erythraea TaxID=1836 RepID=A4FQK2_SACEN|nr:glycerophosphodiester phosphodiesterase [Saccharopolyspora erythraea]EQD87705.1 glycerophosphoryl diester phosphodiesterase [Saccharopolyspora erythraea D]PFG92930.1 glycerophosphoryl diester phosphodiesterase [Saccharopolyspora erythraea NRRL 2338]QRK89828.1 glycerophosphodiester phosphodiesterase [Saccharopolyspora erythraea]CAM06327.1 glycerophosphoryl diester phosphodiesterase [Saccharopolyspora erythraea NRRL 2338]